MAPLAARPEDAAAGAIPPPGFRLAPRLMLENARPMNALANFCSRIFGLALLGLSFFVALETILRKVFSYSFEGADELGGYVLAIGSSLAFVVALVDRAHIRIDVLHSRMPLPVRVMLDWVSIVFLAILGLYMVHVGRVVIVDTIAYGSTAPTPWATPLIWPQALWYAALCIFAIVALVLAAQATWLIARRRFEAIEQMFRPKSAIDELHEEISDLARR